MSKRETSDFSLASVGALVTGAAGGIGLEVAEALASAGARVACADLTEPAKVPEGGFVIVRDLSSPDAARDCVAVAAEELGGIRVVVNCIGLLVSNRPAQEVELSDLTASFAVNAGAVFLVCQEAARRMIATKSAGAITNITSLAESTALPSQAAYTASKGALASLTRALAIDWARYGIRVNSIAPGPVETPLTQDFYANEQVRQRLLDRIPLGRLGRPSDIANAAIFLSSSASDFITGHTLVVDGGWRAGEPTLSLD